MKMSKKLLLMVCMLCGIALCVEARKPIETVIITGQNNHNWKVSHVAIKQILENSGLFDVDLAISPSEGGNMNDFIVDFSKYKLLVLDYNGDDWSVEMQRAFIDFARSGGGIVVYHAANNAFTNWEEFNRICALGGWGGRNEQAGPYVYWQNDRLVKDTSPGNGGSHGARHRYVLNMRNTKHPIVKGLPEGWKHTEDELYDRMRGPGNIKELLYTAYSDKKTGGSGREEPLIFTVDYGKTRIFHLMLGHAGNTLEDNVAMQCTGFQVMLLRGAEWAATGKVKQKVPADFPTADKCTYRKSYKEENR